jgi:hypothetical protein
VLRIGSGGALRLVPGGVVSSGGILPVSVAVSGDLVYVANAGTGGSDYTGFRLGGNGRLQPIPGPLSRCPTALSRVMCCSAATAPSLPGPASAPR